jgi:hypothetical protein
VTHDQAIEIIIEAKTAGVLTQAMPEHEEERIKLAQDIANKAKMALDSGRDTPVIRTILRLAEMSGNGNQERPAELRGNEVAAGRKDRPPEVDSLGAGQTGPAPEKLPERPQQGPQEAPGAPSAPTEYEAPDRVQKRVLARMAQLGLPAPKQMPADQVPEFPKDLTAITDNELRRLHGAFDAMAAWAAYNFALEENDLQSADLLANFKRGEIIEIIDKVDPLTGKAKLLAQIEAEADHHPEVVRWRVIATRHRAVVRLLKAQRDMYQGHVERCSREWTFRNDAWLKMSGGSKR